MGNKESWKNLIHIKIDIVIEKECGKNKLVTPYRFYRLSHLR